MLSTFRKLMKNDRGATAIEYTLIASLIAVAAITAMNTVGGKVTTLSVGHGHDTLCLDAERFQAVFDALTPVVQGATFNDNRRSLSIRLETPDRPPQADPYGNISLPIPFISAAEIPGHVQAFFEKHSLT